MVRHYTEEQLIHKKEYQKEYLRKNKSKFLERSREWRKKNVEKARLSSRKSYKKHKDTINKHKKEEYLKNREKILKKQKEYYIINKEIIKERTSKYCKNNKGKINKRKRRYMKTEHGKKINRLNRIRHRGILKCVINDFAVSEINFLRKESNGICKICKKYIGEEKLTIDHIYPISLSQQNYFITGIKRVYKINDIQLICGSCNSKKSNKIEEVK